ncbi:glutathione S-transferase family protein [Stenoxybacter acetivorans]|uniref:glutathione S-transferase family protein n=1 Tax=Stenoxybacter acetivorans TaxID=422441 RepID=UPI00055BEC26|nr:glutathione S-transferase family protein [Stenoxybacter acetivorans]
MKLYLNATSPFSRAVLAAAILSNHQLELVWTDPWQESPELIEVTPFVTIPVLTIDNGSSISESLCICRYLIESGKGESLCDTDFRLPENVAVLGFAKTLMEIAFRTAVLPRFDMAESAWARKGKQTLQQAVKQLEQDLAEQPARYQTADLAVLYLQVALDYLQLRHADILSLNEYPYIRSFLRETPFTAVLQQISLATLAKQPRYGDW